ncbi:MAG: formate-dependent phosphoribosylglycinamide formyltransferase [Phycisphaerales bacterium]|nr:formate-dependent phosphoribosylglycinamide formyltransferase [Phycisphaerales bacterium]
MARKKTRSVRRGAGSRGAAMPTLMMLGSGELGKEFVICAKRLGCRVVAVDRYDDAPAMQVADAREVIDMLDGAAIRRVVRRHRPDFVVPEIEAIRTEALIAVERAGTTVIPSALAAHLTMNRDAIRSLAAEELGLPTARYAYATSAGELERIVMGHGRTKGVGLPCVIKPVMSSSGKGQSVARTRDDLARSWKYAIAGMRGDKRMVIAEEFIDFDYEITLLTVKQRRSAGGGTTFVAPLGHRQERGDYQESWMPCPMKPALVREAQRMAKAITDRIAGPEGAGIFGVEFFVKGNRVIFSELSPRPHDTGMVTMASQDLSEFELHLRAVLGLPIPRIEYRGPTASAVILADFESDRVPAYAGIDRALRTPGVEIRIFGKPSTRPYRRMGVALATGRTVADARKKARAAAAAVQVRRA